MTHTAPSIVRGSVIALRLFDVAYAIDLPKAENYGRRNRVPPAEDG